MLSLILWIVFVRLMLRISDFIKNNEFQSLFLLSTSELRVRLVPWNRFKPSSKIIYWPFQGGAPFVDHLCFFLSCVCYAFVHVCLYVPCGHLLGKGWPLGSRLWCLTVSLSLSHCILGQAWYLIVSIPDLCTLTYFHPDMLEKKTPSDSSSSQ